MGSLLWSTAASGGGTAEPSYGPAPAPLDGPELPSFRYPLGSNPAACASCIGIPTPPNGSSI